ESGLKMFAFTTKHHEGFSMFDTKTRVRNRVQWNAPGGPAFEGCDVAYSMMETPFRRDVVKELCAAGHKRGLRIALYFSHPDWYDADFRPYADHPVQIPSAAQFDTEAEQSKKALGKLIWIAPDPGKAEVNRMLRRHRAQIEELLTNYGKIDMLSLDQWLGPRVWPQLRETVLRIRQLQPDIMIRARGIGNYGDYYTPEGFVPGSKSNTGMPWMVIYPLARGFSFDPDASQYKGAQWIIKNIVDTSAKGGSFQVGVGPDGAGRFYPTAIQQLKEAGKWLKVCGSGIYATRAYFEPFTRLFQLLNGGGMETAGAIGADADLETTALCGCIHDVFDDPLRAFVLRCIWIKRKAARQRINDHPGHACIRFTTRNETFRRIVISVIANAARADH